MFVVFEIANSFLFSRNFDRTRFDFVLCSSGACPVRFLFCILFGFSVVRRGVHVCEFANKVC